MAIDLTDAVQVSIFETLRAGVTLAPVYAVLPDPPPTPPYLIIDDDDVDYEIGGKGGGIEQHTLRLVTIITGSSKRPLTAIMNQAIGALDGQPLLFPGASIEPARLTSSNTRTDAINGVVIGEQTFVTFVQPA